ncbi:MAG: hypothetical protein KGR48_09880 [Alphaproteobacteria bacterium]|nr:hypothetical protein [Alphaproteobacteria bacterium]MDE2013468.1 hypothetical protein [Alphaproteobacteria bacterium]MDE2073500.1 hypothetical protein [Alphaproteobacteria bacterium]MDE2350845.1 hypothetical protein [Alphaproteobacteria bacterium]
MAQQEVHFEIFARHGARGGWKLHDVASRRDGALAMAQALMAEGQATGVKVVKETYNSETGDYLTLKIFEDGHNKAKVDPAAEDVPNALPCFKPDDLYSYHARATMARLLSDYLARQKLTVTELIHRADALEKFEATGTVYQHAIQKVAVAQASSTKKPVQQIIKDLNELVTKAIHRVYRDERRNHFPDVSAGGFRALADKLANESDGAYVLNGTVARHLADARGWEEKLVRLLAIMEEATDESPGAMLLLGAVDGITAEILGGSAALHELIGAHDNLGDALTTLIHLFLGQPRPDAEPRNGLTVLTRHFAADNLPSARTAIANRIMAELRSIRRLQEEALLEEIAMLKRIANKLVLGQGKYLSHDDLIAAFTMRSRRLVTYEALARFLETVTTPDDKLEKLLLIEKAIIGAENKRQLATAITPIVSSAAFANFFHSSDKPVLSRLKRLAALQMQVLGSSLQDNQKSEIAQTLDKIAGDVETRARLLDTIAMRPASHVEKVLTVLKLCNTGVLTQGRLAARAQDFILSHMAKPNFLADYVAHVSRGDTVPAPDEAKAELVEMLEKAGIAQETSGKSFAA